MSVPTLPLLEPYIQAGIDPATRLPSKLLQSDGTRLKSNICNALTIVDEQDAINRFVWEGLPEELTSQMIERMLYYKGQLAFFKMEADDKFYCLPYALSGNIDCYGRWRQITPIPYVGGDKPWINGYILSPVYDLTEEVDPYDSCVIIRDYTNNMSQVTLPRVNVNKPIVDLESDCLPFLRTALLNSTGVSGIRVQNETDSNNVMDASRAIDNAALTGNKYIPVIGSLDFQDLAGGAVAKSEEFLLTMQSIDNFRLSLLGINNGGLFQKKAHELESEQRVNSGNDSITLQDALHCREQACEIINNVYGLNVTVRPNDQALNNEDAEYTSTDDYDNEEDNNNEDL